MIENLFIIYFAQAYGEGSYSSDVYQGAETTTGDQTGTNGQTVQDTTAPSTGFINSGPEILVPVILGASIVVAVVVTVIRKQLRKSRNQ